MPVTPAARPEKRTGRKDMARSYLAAMAVACVTAATIATSAQAQRPQIQTTKVDGTDNVYIFRNGNHQSMFVVTKDGVIATDPIAYGRPTGGQTYVDEIKKVTDKPIKYLVYSHHHYDHIAGGKAFKDAGARIIAHKKVKERLAPLGDPNTVLPDETFERKKTNPLGWVPGRGFIDIYPLETETFIKKVLAMDWERLIPGHPGAPNGRLGSKKDAEDQLTLLQDASAEMKKLGQDGKCWDAAEKEFKLPKYAGWPGYENGLPFIARRYCGLWGRGT